MSSPVAAQVSDKMDPGQLVSLIAALNPENTPGRLTVIIRMGADKVCTLCWEEHILGTSEPVPIRCSGNTTLHRNVGSERQNKERRAALRCICIYNMQDTSGPGVRLATLLIAHTQLHLIPSSK